MIGVFMFLESPCFSVSATVPKNCAARDCLETISAVFCNFFSLAFCCLFEVSPFFFLGDFFLINLFSSFLSLAFSSLDDG